MIAYSSCRSYGKIIFLALLSAGLMTLFACPAFADLKVRSAILLNANTGKVLFAQNADRSIQPASLTKIVSMFVALDAVRAGKVGLEDKVRVSRRAARQGGSRMFLKAGDNLTLDRLLFGMAISSGNDASLAVAEKVGGSANDFVGMMNAKVRSLGLQNTTFANVHGLPSTKQRTTARDMAAISMAYLRAHPSALRYHRTLAMRHNGVVTTNKNPLLGHYEGADGLKTGWVNASGYNIVTTVERGNTRLLAVVLGAPDSTTRAREIRRLMDAGFASVDGKSTVASLLPTGGKEYRADASGQSKKKSAVRKRSSKSKKSEAAKRSTKSQASKKAVTSKKVAAKASSKKSVAKATAANKKGNAQKKAARTASNTGKSSKSGNAKSSKWVASGSLMDS